MTNDTQPTFTTIPNFSRYEITESGIVRNKKTGRILISQTQTSGYQNLLLINDHGKKQNLLLHRAVALTYIPNPENLPEVDHWDNDRNNNHVSNLSWMSSKENGAKRKNPSRRCTEEVKTMLLDGMSGKAVAEHFGLAPAAVYRYARRNDIDYKHSNPSEVNPTLLLSV